MITKNEPATDTSSQSSLGDATPDREVFITRDFDAPRELVFAAWTDPAHLARWFAPHGCEISFREIEVREGGTFHSCVRPPGGHDCWCRGVYREVAAPERLVFTMAVADERGNLIEPTEAGMEPGWPRETVVTVTLSELDGRTRLTLRQTVSEALARKTGAYPSWLQMFDRLDSELER